MRKNYLKMLMFLTAFAASYFPRAYSETLIAPASFLVYQGDITQWLTEQIAPYLVSNKVFTPQIAFSQPYNTIVHNPEYQGMVTFTWTKNAANNVWVFDGEANGIVLQASSFEVHDTILETIGGSVVPIAVNAVCQNMALNLPGIWKIHGELPVSWSGGQVGAPLQNFLLTPSTQVPILTLGACSGPTGLAQFLNQRIQAGFASPAAMQTMAATQIQAFVNSELTNVQAKIGKPNSFSLLGVNVAFTPTSPSNLPNGTWILDGSMVFTGNGNNTTTTLPKDYTSENLSDATASGFGFSSVNFWPAVLQFAQDTGIFYNQFPSSNVPGFTAFMQDRTEQMMAWQDLWNFATNTVFGVTLRSTQTPQIASLDNGKRSGIAATVTAPIDALMTAPTKLGNLPYVEFWSTNPASVQLTAKAASSGALQVNYSVTQVPLTYGYRKEFYKVRTPTDSIYTPDLSNAITSSLTNQVWSYTIPAAASPFPGDTMYFKNVFVGPETFRVDMGIQPQ